jgi:hypothetical protein
MNTVELLKAARELVANPKTWTKGEMARDANGHPTGWGDSDAVCWCAMGAMAKVDDDDDRRACFSADTHLHRAARRLYPAAVKRRDDMAPLAAVNDVRGRKAALACFDAAIRSAKRAGK